MSDFKILVISPGWIGDTIMSQSLLKIIKHRHPEAIIDAVSPSWCADVLSRMPEINQVIISPFKRGQFQLGDRYRLGKALRKNGYQQAYVLANSFKSALVPFFAKIPRRTGWLGEMRYGLLNDARKLNPKAIPLMVERYKALAYSENEHQLSEKFFPQLVTTEERVSAALAKLGMTHPNKPIIGFCPGAEFGGSKRWPTKYFADIAKSYVKKGWDVWIFGGPKDRPIANEIQEASGNICVDLSGKTNLSEAIDLLSITQKVLTNDTGLMHIAAALDKPMIVIYGSSSPTFTPPLSDKAKIEWLKVDCAPCFKRECPLGHFKCMNSLYPEKILESLDTL